MCVGGGRDGELGGWVDAEVGGSREGCCGERFRRAWIFLRSRVTLEGVIQTQILQSESECGYDINMRKQAVKRPVSQGRASKAAQNLQTTLRLPKQLYARVKSHVQRDQAISVNEFIVNALSAYLRAVERKAIDDAFLGMAADRQYQREALTIAEQFAASDAEALELSERDLIGA